MTDMETIEAYLNRKHAELRLLNDCLRRPLTLPYPRSVTEVINHKFQLTAALRSEHELYEWSATETAWSHEGRCAGGPFEFKYDYQRADLDVRGPSFYAIGDKAEYETIYTASGMAAISTLLFASANVIGEADIFVLPGSYGETLELIAGHTRHLRLFTLPVKEATAPYSRPQILLLDSCITASAFEGALRCIEPKFELLIFDTTCFAGGSGRIRRVLRWAHNYSIPVVMVRSHTKLDSLGAEYGRLGSAVFVLPDKNDRSSSLSKFEKLKAETRDAVRLFGNAALPAHFPPYVGRPSYRALTNRRVAAILRNGRRSALHFASAFRAEVNFAHGLYLTLDSAQPLDERTARAAASQMSNDLRREGFPIRHAGSFGFDFAATEWFQHSTTKRYSVRVAVADLPTGLWDDLSRAVASWWATHGVMYGSASGQMESLR